MNNRRLALRYDKSAPCHIVHVEDTGVQMSMNTILLYSN